VSSPAAVILVAIFTIVGVVLFVGAVFLFIF